MEILANIVIEGRMNAEGMFYGDKGTIFPFFFFAHIRGMKKQS